MSEQISESSGMLGFWWCNRCQKYISNDLPTRCQHDARADEIASLRRELAEAQARVKVLEGALRRCSDLAVAYANAEVTAALDAGEEGPLGSVLPARAVLIARAKVAWTELENSINAALSPAPAKEEKP